MYLFTYTTEVLNLKSFRKTHLQNLSHAGFGKLFIRYSMKYSWKRKKDIFSIFYVWYMMDLEVGKYFHLANMKDLVRGGTFAYSVQNVRNAEMLILHDL